MIKSSENINRIGTFFEKNKNFEKNNLLFPKKMSILIIEKF